MTRRNLLGLLTAFLVVPAALGSPSQPSYSGTWKQSDERCVPVRKGEVTRRIEQKGASILVETTILRSSGPPRHAVQRYTTDGAVSVSTGADGDEFHTSVVWNGPSLVFSVEEHEDGRILHSTETWELIDNGSALRVSRGASDGDADGARKQTLILLRQSTGPDGR